jgi:hypothetical protein
MEQVIDDSRTTLKGTPNAVMKPRLPDRKIGEDHNRASRVNDEQREQHPFGIFFFHHVTGTQKPRAPQLFPHGYYRNSFTGLLYFTFSFLGNQPRFSSNELIPIISALFFPIEDEMSGVGRSNCRDTNAEIVDLIGQNEKRGGYSVSRELCEIIVD